MPHSPIGTFEKDGRTKTAYTQTEVVTLKFNGWKPSDPAARAAVAAVSTGPTPPPLAGSGSGEKAWAAYAEQLGVSVPEDAKRDDIVDAVRSAGHPVEQ